MADSDSSRQEEEIEALSAIYEDDFMMVDSTGKLFDVRVRHEGNPWWSLTIQVLMPQNYPSVGPPVFEIHGAWLAEHDEFELRDKLYAIHRENIDNCVVFQWVEAVREFMNEKSALYAETEGVQNEELRGKVPDNQQAIDPKSEDTPTNEVAEVTSLADYETDDNLPEIVHGEPITDRKSTFQAHLVKVSSEQDVRDALHELGKTRKIANATHNIFAYRIRKQDSQVVIQDCEDDGENHAGSRVLHLLQILNVENYLIVVSRWYGGIHLGPDRFKHINNCARSLLKDAKVIKDSSSKPGHGAQHRDSRLRFHKKNRK